MPKALAVTGTGIAQWVSGVPSEAAGKIAKKRPAR